MSVGSRIVVAFLGVLIGACTNQVPSTTTKQIATVTPFNLPPTWTPSVSSSPKFVPTVSPTFSPIPEPTISPSYTLIPRVTTSPLPDIADFRLWELLSRFGQPSNVYINTSFGSPTGEVPFSLVIYYDTIGIIALYDGWATVNNEMIYFCSKSARPVATSYQDFNTSDNSEFFDAFVNEIGYWLNDAIGLLPLQDSSNLSVEQFYQYFHNQNNGSCIVTPSDTWVSDKMFSSLPTSTQTPVYPWVETARPTE